MPPITASERARLAADLARLDPDFEPLVAWAGPPDLGRGRVRGGAFAHLARAIVYQQLAGAAASTIHGRFSDALGGRVTPEAVLDADPASLRSCGLSAAKTASIVDLSERVMAKELNLSTLSRLPDDEVVARLVTVRGIGPWTAEMFLMFYLGRPDVWPTGDLGVRVGFGLVKGMEVAPTAQQLQPLGDPYLGMRSIVAWYCWRAVDRHRVSPTP